MTQTEEVRIYIRQILNDARANGLSEIILRSGDIHKSLQLVAKLPICCSAMRSIDGYKYVEMSSPPKGRGCNLYIKYFLN